MRKSLTSVVGLVLLWTVLAAAHALGDAPPGVAVGELGASAPELADALGASLTRQLAAHHDVRLAPDARRAAYVVRGSVVSVDERTLADGLEVRCAVSLIVSDARGGSVRAMLTGRAGARGVEDRARLAQAALDGAVRGALRGLPELSARRER